MRKRFTYFRICVVAAALCLLLPSVPAAFAGTGDAGPSWASGGLSFLSAAGILPQGINPDSSISRGEFAVILYKLFNLSPTVGDNYSDVNRGENYYDAVDTLKADDVTTSVDNKFNPDSPLTRLDAMVMTYRAMSRLEGLPPAANTDLSAFADSGSIPAGDVEAVATLVNDKVVNGINGRIVPNGNMSYASAATLVYRAINVSVGKEKYKTFPVSLNCQAGSAWYKQWTSGQTADSGIGYFEPFGSVSFTTGTNYAEANNYPISNYFSAYWMATYNTRLFCIYQLSGGDIYAYEGTVGRMLTDNGKGYARTMNALVDIVVGGTGAYRDATGILLGETQGAGNYSQVSATENLPASLRKHLAGYIKLPDRPGSWVYGLKTSTMLPPVQMLGTGTKQAVGGYLTMPAAMAYEAGSSFYKPWSSGMAIHGGIGYFEPFGEAAYTGGFGYAEEKGYPIPEYFSNYWMKNYSTALFCLYQFKDGDLVVYDGIFGSLIADNGKGEAHRKDALVNVIIGGTGVYKGASGILVGQTHGSGPYANVNPKEVLPQSLIKELDGFVKLPATSAAAQEFLPPAAK